MLRTHRFVSPLFMIVAAGTAAPAWSGVPGPSAAGCFPNEVPCWGRSNLVVSGMTSPCQFFFRPDGGEDVMVASITLRDAFDTPVVGCSVSVDLTATPLTQDLCSCGSSQIFGVTDAMGATEVVFSDIGGRGELGLEVTVRCVGKVAFWSERFNFTSTDQNGSCGAGVSTDVFDLGVWASGLPPGYAVESDFNCDGVVNVFDLGDFAGGLTASCSP